MTTATPTTESTRHTGPKPNATSAPAPRALLRADGSPRRSAHRPGRSAGRAIGTCIGAAVALTMTSTAFAQSSDRDRSNTEPANTYADRDASSNNQELRDDRDARTDPRTRRLESRSYTGPLVDVDYRTAEDLLDIELEDLNDEDIGDIDDLLIERGTGKVVAVIVTLDEFIGLGGDMYAIDIDRVVWPGMPGRNAQERRAIVELDDDEALFSGTIDEIRAMNTFDPDLWDDADVNTEDIFAGWARDMGLFEGSHDAYDGPFEDAEEVSITGRVLEMQRIETEQNERIVIMVRDEDDASDVMAVDLGPSWFVTSDVMAPRKGAMVAVDAFRVPNESRIFATLAHIRTHGEEYNIRYRGDDGTPAWILNPMNERGDEIEAANLLDPRRRMVLVSDLIDRDVRFADHEEGEIEDVLIDRLHNRVGPVVIDPDIAPLGIGDTERLLPWTLLTVPMDGDVGVGVTREVAATGVKAAGPFDEVENMGAAEEVWRRFDEPLPGWMIDRDAQQRDRSRNNRGQNNRGS